MSFRRFILAIVVALGLAFSTNIAAGTASACDPSAHAAGLC
jgi:hypothetical protein